MTDEQVDYEDLTEMRLVGDELAPLLESPAECVFNWTNRDGYPVGVVVAYVWRDNKFWTTCAARRKRVPALRARPQSGVVVNRGGRTASFRGDSIIHTPDDDDFADLKSWFYRALSRVDEHPDDPYRQSFLKFLDSPHRVIIETEANLVVGFDTAKFSSFTNDAINAGHGA